MFLLKSTNGLDCVGNAGPFHLNRTQTKRRMRLNRGTCHGNAVLHTGEFVIRLVWWRRVWYPPDLIEPELVSRDLSYDEVGNVRRIEGSSEETDVHSV